MFASIRGEKDDLLIFGGEDHKSATSDDAADRLKRLEAWARQRFPKLGAIEDSWSGQIYEPADYLPFIGKSPGHKTSVHRIGQFRRRTDHRRRRLAHPSRSH